VLKLVHETVGPIQGKFVDAFSFTRFDNGQYGRSGENNNDEENERETAPFRTRFATTDSIFTRVDDFWALVGWAFNCSCLPDMYQSRWTHYELLLTFFLDVLETDWQLHFAANTCEESLIWNFIELGSGGFWRGRRILRAVFADGGSRSLNEFREVFHNELKLPKSEEDKYKKRTTAVDIDKDEFGDYLGAEDSDDSASDPEIDTADTHPSKRIRRRTPTRRRSARSSTDSLRSNYEEGAVPASQTTETPGPPSSLRLRLRLLQLLSDVSSHQDLFSTSPTTFPDVIDLYTLFVEFIKPLPLPIFTQIICPCTAVDALSDDAASTLSEMMLQRMLESSAPSESDEDYLTLGKFIRCYAPFAAGGKGDVEAQARVSIVLEGMLRRCARAGMLRALIDNEENPDEVTREAQQQQRTSGHVSTNPVTEHSAKTVNPNTSFTSTSSTSTSTAMRLSSSATPPTKSQFLTAVTTGIEHRNRRARESIDRACDSRAQRMKGRKKKKEDEDEDREEEVFRVLGESGRRMGDILRGL
jgi:hypothetical protein